MQHINPIGMNHPDTHIPNQNPSSSSNHCHCHDHAHKEPAHSHEGHSGCHCHHHEVTQEPDAAILAQASNTRAIYRITKMDCPMEEALIRKKLATVPGISGLKFNLLQRILIVDHAPGSTEAIEKALEAIDMAPEALQNPAEAGELRPDIPWVRLVVAGILAALSEGFDLIAEWQPQPFSFLNLPIGGHPFSEILAFILAICAILLSGTGTFKKGWLAISNFNLNMNALMAVAVTGAFLIGQFPEAAMVMVLFNISEAIEARALDQARNAIRNLMALAPDKADMQMPDGSFSEVELKDIPVGSLVRIRPGQKIGLDGEIISGHSEVNQAPITGESMPVEKGPGDTVFAGAINESGSFEYKTTSEADNSTLARIIHAVEEAQGSRAPMQRFVDVFAKYYTPAVFLFALLWAVLTPIISGASWYDSIYTSLVILVIGCPCALVISTPVTVVSGMAAATARGILIKGGLYLEMGRRMNWLCLDKTGTITWGQPKLTDFASWNDFPAEKARLIAQSLASRSDHPVSKALAAGAVTPLKIQDFAAIPGQGISGEINGEKWNLGKYVAQNPDPALKKAILDLERKGNTVVVLTGPKGVAGLFAVADSVRQSSIEAIARLEAMHVNVMMLTGDNESTAMAIAAETGVTEVKANLLPGDKLKIIENLEAAGNIVGMAGDGINDSPALARANIGFAMAGGGTDTAIETADVALMDDDLRKIPSFIRLSRATYAILVENICIALLIKLVFFVLTLTGNATMWMAVFADVGAALIVVANGLRVGKKRIN